MLMMMTFHTIFPQLARSSKKLPHPKKFHLQAFREGRVCIGIKSQSLEDLCCEGFVRVAECLLPSLKRFTVAIYDSE